MEEVRYLLGRLMERSEHTQMAVGRIEYRQIGIAREIQAVKERVTMLEAKSPPPAGEVWIKRFLTIAAPAGTLWATGSAEKAMDMLRLFLH